MSPCEALISLMPHHRALVPLDSCPGKAWAANNNIMAKYAIFYLASLFCYTPLQTIIISKSKDKAKPILLTKIKSF